MKQQLSLIIFVFVTLFSVTLVLSAPQSFCADITIENDPNVVGTVNGQLYYDFSQQKMRLDYDSAPTSATNESLQIFWDYNAGTVIKLCPDNCATFDDTSLMPVLFDEGSDLGCTPILGTDCGQKSDTTASGGVLINEFTSDNQVVTYWYNADTSITVPKQWTFANVDTSCDLSSSVLDPPSTGLECDSSCNAQVDIWFILDESGSIDSDNFTLMIDFAIGLVDSFVVSPDDAMFGVVFFTTDSRLLISLDPVRDNIVNALSNTNQREQRTCIVCGIDEANDDLIPNTRPGVPKLYIVLTDGVQNEPTNDFNTNFGMLQDAVDDAIAQNVIRIAIPVGSEIRDSEIDEIVKDQQPNVDAYKFPVDNFNQLASIVDDIIAIACPTYSGTECGTYCAGVCSCGNVCVCPDTCDDYNVCTTDYCDPDLNNAGCIFEDITASCDDNDLCTDDSCDPTNGCEYVDISSNCDDSNLCTDDSCDPLQGCQYVNIDCDDNDLCTTDTCNPSVGCEYTAVPIDDGDFCTIDSCDPALGVQHTPVDCDDNDLCTTDTCNPSVGCEYEAVVTDDGNDCTIDACDPTVGITYTPVDCDDGDACTTDTCEPVGGCMYSAVTCNDNDFCTADSCDSTVGCVFQNITTDCDLNQACLDWSCNPSVGCQYSDRVCDDSDACTIDTCDNSTGCIYTIVDCNDGDACTIDTCDPVLQCQYEDADCTLCEESSGGVVTPKNCSAEIAANGNLCEIIECDLATGNCVTVSTVQCDDGNECTTDACEPTTGLCEYTARTCNSGDLCILGTCDDTPGVGCVFTDVLCDDGNDCTSDSCDSSSGNCDFVADPSLCDDSNPCTNDYCDSNGVCVFENIVCDDGNLCTTDSCDPTDGSCDFDAVVCDDSDLCTVDSCNTTDGACVYTSVVCDDGNLCTTDSCDPTDGSCVSTAVVCDDGDLCTIDSCDTTDGSCVSTPKVCDDSNLCSVDSCDSTTGECVYVAVDCSDGNECTLDTCDPVTGCSSTAYNETTYCDDYNLCTVDTCDPAVGCVHTDIVCNDNVNCTVDSCNVLVGCEYTPVACVPFDNCHISACYESNDSRHDGVEACSAPVEGEEVDLNNCYNTEATGEGQEYCINTFVEYTECVSELTQPPPIVEIAIGIIILIVILSLAAVGLGGCGAVKGYAYFSAIGSTNLNMATESAIYLEGKNHFNNPLTN